MNMKSIQNEYICNADGHVKRRLDEVYLYKILLIKI